MTFVLAWIAALSGLALAYIVCLAAGMQTVPRMSGASTLVALILPCLALLLGLRALLHIGSSEHVLRTVIFAGPPVALSALTLFFVLSTFLTQPAMRGAFRRSFDAIRGKRSTLPHSIQATPWTVRFGDSWPSQWTRLRLARGYDAIHQPEAEVMRSARVIECESAASPKPRRVLVGASSTDGGAWAESVAIDNGCCFVALGHEVICLSLPELSIVWRTDLAPQRPRSVRVVGHSVSVGTVQDGEGRSLLAADDGELQT